MGKRKKKKGFSQEDKANVKEEEKQEEREGSVMNRNIPSLKQRNSMSREDAWGRRAS
jgi:hypothetical protein